MTEAIARPWYMERSSDNPNTWAIKAETAPAFFVAECFILGEKASAKANAALIVKAVNAHDYLTIALRVIEKLADAVVIPGGENESSQALAFDRGAQKAFEKAAGIARIALAKVDA